MIFCKKRTHTLPETKIDGWKTIFLGPGLHFRENVRLPEGNDQSKDQIDWT